MRRTFRGGARSPRINRTWTPSNATWTIAVATATSVVELMAFEEPAATVFTTMPPEDIIIDRVVGSFDVLVSAAGNWTLGLLVADRGWTTTSAFSADADKRILWHETFENQVAGGALWQCGLVWTVGTLTLATAVMSPERKYRVDISPKIRLQAGKALFLVAWEDAGAAAFSTTSRDMRILWHRARR